MKSIVLKSVLIAGLFAMIPGALNGRGPEGDNPGNGKNASRAILSSQQDSPLGWAYLRGKKTFEIFPAIGGGRKANLVFSGTNTNEVYKIYYIDAAFKDDNIHHRPAEVLSLIYHNLGDDAFLGIKIMSYLYHDKNEPNKITGYLYREVNLDDTSAQYLVDFMTNDTKWTNKTDIGYEETDNPKVMVPEVY